MRVTQAFNKDFLWTWENATLSKLHESYGLLMWCKLFFTSIAPDSLFLRCVPRVMSVYKSTTYDIDLDFLVRVL